MKREAYTERDSEGNRVQDWPEPKLRERVREMGGNPEIEAWIVALVRGLADWEAISEITDRQVADLRRELDRLRGAR